MTSAPADADVSGVFLALVDARGGRAAFNSAEVEIAAAAATIICQLRSADPDDQRKLSTTLGALLNTLPPENVRAKPRHVLGVLSSKTSLPEAANLFYLHIQDPDGDVLIDEADPPVFGRRDEEPRSPPAPLVEATRLEPMPSLSYPTTSPSAPLSQPEILPPRRRAPAPAVVVRDAPLARGGLLLQTREQTAAEAERVASINAAVRAQPSHADQFSPRRSRSETVFMSGRRDE